MNTLNDTANSTVDHGQADCLCPDDRCIGYHHEVGEPCPCTRALKNEPRDYVNELAESYTYVDGGTDGLGTIVRDNGVESLIAHKVILDRESDSLTIVRDKGSELAADYVTNAVTAPYADEWKQITTRVAEDVINGSSRTEWLFTLGIQMDLEVMRTRLIHPAGCGGGECLPISTVSEIEHHSAEETITAGPIEAKADAYLITDHLDYLKDPTPSWEHYITLGGEGFFAATGIVSGTPKELRALGEFIVAQADRFKSFGATSAVSAVSA